jgi:hypothetical protein
LQPEIQQRDQEGTHDNAKDETAGAAFGYHGTTHLTHRVGKK